MTSRTLEERIEHARKMKIKEKEQGYRGNLKHKYRITPEEKLQMAKDQQYRCANLRCNKLLNWSKISTIPVDHCHKTGKIRALLCVGCNTTLGHLEIEDERLRGLHEYIARHK